MPRTIIGNYSIRDHSAPHIAPVPVFLNSEATRTMADGMTACAELLHGAHRHDPALACIRRAYAYLQTSQRLARAAQRTTDGDMTRIRDEYLSDVDTALAKLAKTTRKLGATYPPDNTANLINPAHQHYHHWLEAHMPAQMMVNLTNRMFQPDDQPIENPGLGNKIICHRNHAQDTPRGDGTHHVPRRPTRHLPLYNRA